MSQYTFFYQHRRVFPDKVSEGYSCHCWCSWHHRFTVLHFFSYIPVFTDSIGNIKSAPAKHSHDMQHNIDWSNPTILTTAADRHQLNLLEHAAISTYNPPMNRQHKGPRVSPMWTPILNKITSDFSPTTADIRL